MSKAAQRAGFPGAPPAWLLHVHGDDRRHQSRGVRVVAGGIGRRVHVGARARSRLVARRAGAKAEISLDFLAGYASYEPSRPLSRLERAAIAFAGPAVHITLSTAVLLMIGNPPVRFLRRQRLSRPLRRVLGGTGDRCAQSAADPSAGRRQHRRGGRRPLLARQGAPADAVREHRPHPRGHGLAGPRVRNARASSCSPASS